MNDEPRIDPLMSADLMSRIQRVFASVFGRQVPFNASLTRTSEPRWTSLRHVEFVIALEVEFGVRFDGADATDMTSVAVVAERVAQRLG
jgi:acyl carrier protein